MEVPPSMVTQAVHFCSIQPCPRKAEGELEVSKGDGRRNIPVCARHAEYIMNLYNSEEVEDESILTKEIVFVDDVGEGEMLDAIIENGNYHEIIRP